MRVRIVPDALADVIRRSADAIVKAGLATLREGVSWRHVCGTAWLAGIGFTMALFISGLAFPGTGLESQAKLGILLGSLMSAVVGIAILLTTRRDVKTLPE